MVGRARISPFGVLVFMFQDFMQEVQASFSSSDFMVKASWKCLLNYDTLAVSLVQNPKTPIFTRCQIKHKYLLKQDLRNSSLHPQCRSPSPMYISSRVFSKIWSHVVFFVLDLRIIFTKVNVHIKEILTNHVFTKHLIEIEWWVLPSKQRVYHLSSYEKDILEE